MNHLSFIGFGGEVRQESLHDARRSLYKSRRLLFRIGAERDADDVVDTLNSHPTFRRTEFVTSRADLRFGHATTQGAPHSDSLDLCGHLIPIPHSYAAFSSGSGSVMMA